MLRPYPCPPLYGYELHYKATEGYYWTIENERAVCLHMKMDRPQSQFDFTVLCRAVVVVSFWSRGHVLQGNKVVNEYFASENNKLS